MRNKVLLSVARAARIGALLTVAVLAAVMMAGPAAAHCPSHHHCDGGDTGTNEAATFTVDVSVDLLGSVTFNMTVNGNESSIQTRGTGDPPAEHLTLNMAGFLDNVGLPDEWDQCFADSSFEGVLQVSADKNDPGTGFWFTAEDNDATTETEIKYQLAVTLVTIERLDGADWGAVWPHWLPDVDDTVIVTGGPWEMLKGNGPGRKVACTGEGTGETLDFTILVTRTG